jgi:hypothetical protein
MSVPKKLTKIPLSQGGFITPLGGSLGTHLTFDKSDKFLHMRDNLPYGAKINYDISSSGDITSIYLKIGNKKIKL